MGAKRGTLFVLSGASGVGKGSMLQLVLAQTPDLHFSVSWTTRPPRASEVEGRDYFFKSREEFERELSDPEGAGFLEHAEFVGNLYGTPRRAVESLLAAGHDVILDIELDGAMQVARKLTDAVLILVVPPSLSVLRLRLLRRGTDALPVIRRRLERAVRDMARAPQFHFVIVNGELHSAVDDLAAIVRSQRLRASRIDAADLAVFGGTDPDLEAELDRVEAKIRDSGAD